MKHTLLISFCLTWLCVAAGTPRVESDSLRTRHDMLLLRDAGLIDSAVLTWPWPLGRKAPERLQGGAALVTRGSAERWNRLYRSASELGVRPAEVHFGAATEDQPFPPFGYSPDGEIQAGVSLSWLSEWLAGNLSLSYVDGSGDEDDLWLDGSYLSVALGNWAFSLDKVDRWWGPGYDGSLILSNNARPVPAVSLTRISPDPFAWKWLRWIGPWTFTTFMGQLDNDEEPRPGSDARLFGMRIDFTPFGWQNLDIGLSRAAQWAGDGRPGDLSTFWRLLKGEDNRVNNVTFENEPGNQLAGVDYRLRIPRTSWAHYGQLIGEDEETFLPDAVMLLFGLEHWGELAAMDATYRVYFEWTDTRAGHLIRDPRPNNSFNIAYNHGIYQTGYRYRGKVIGHAMDGDGLMRSLGGFVAQKNGNLWGAKLRDYALNRDGAGRHSVTADPIDGWSFELFAELNVASFGIQEAGDLSLNLGLHYIDEENLRTGNTDDSVGGYISLSKDL